MIGYFITIEGTDGAGKTTQIQLLTQYLKESGYTVVVTREPGGTPCSEKIRELLLDTKNSGLCDMAEVLLYAAARAQHVREKIVPAIEQGSIVICDRFLDSSIAYQGYGRGLGIEMVETINEYATGGMKPHKTFYLELAPEKGITRKQKEAGHCLDRMEQQTMTFHKRVYEGYRQLCIKYPDRIKKIDASKSIEEIQKQIREEIKILLNQ